MKRYLIIIIFISLFIVFCAITGEHSSLGDKIISYPGYELVWADEFEREGVPDPCNWNYERGFVRNEELQWYQKENVFCEDGVLVIEGRRERKKNPRYDANSNDWKRMREYCEYTSSSILTRGLHSWQYGRFEMRGRFATKSGLWPAFWTLGVRGEWPSSGEIDIMEYYRGKLLANAAWGTERRYRARWDSVTKAVGDFNDAGWDEKFHVWRMDWDANNIRLYVDDILLNEVDVKETINASRDGRNPFRQEHYIILNLAIGGTNGGDPQATKFPTRYEVDYVRVYQKIVEEPAR